jgi:hypothetical protein
MGKKSIETLGGESRSRDRGYKGIKCPIFGLASVRISGIIPFTKQLWQNGIVLLPLIKRGYEKLRRK